MCSIRREADNGTGRECIIGTQGKNKDQAKPNQKGKTGYLIKLKLRRTLSVSSVKRMDT